LFKTSEVLVVGVIAAAGAVAAVVDVRTRRVPNRLTFTTAACGLVLAALGATPIGVVSALLSLVLALALMMPAHVVGATGAGDVKLFAAFATLLGPSGTASAFLYCAVAGGVLALVAALSRRRVGQTLARTAALITTRGAIVPAIEADVHNRFAYAPAIVAGALVAAVWPLRLIG
jgi:prepilin peptidase CpaA